MDCIATRLPYRQTASFSKIALDYIDQADQLKSFFSYPPTIRGIEQSIEARKAFPTDRSRLVAELEKQYAGITTDPKVKANIKSLLSPDTFTVTTAHQNNLFTGPLYFVYKIVHAIRLADHLNRSLTTYRFVPVYYMGTEDADLDELNHFYLGNEKLSWATSQKGAVGKMKIDKKLIALIDQAESELTVLPHGKVVIELLRKNYREGITIQEATFGFVNALFADYGLVILLPDNPALKSKLVPVFKDELVNQTASEIVAESAKQLEKSGYKIQAQPREINLFYLNDDTRERITRTNEQFTVLNSSIRFSEKDLLRELGDHPDRFSPNVILRGLYQATILPDIAFIGGAGELAYWLQLKSLHEHYKIPFPVLLLRNSFLLIERKWQERIAKTGFSVEDFFLAEEELMNWLVKRESEQLIQLNGELETVEKLYATVKAQASSVDKSLEKHVDALRTRTITRLQELEKKMLRAEKRKFSDRRRQLQSIRENLFPGNGLQERRDNICYYYALWGPDIIKQLYNQSLALEQEFTIITELK
jgi:bacillithiol synthase